MVLIMDLELVETDNGNMNMEANDETSLGRQGN